VSFSKLLAAAPEERARGAVAFTAGGHGVGVSHAARALGIPVEVFVPRWADPRKLETIRRQGAAVRLFGSVEEARAAAKAAAAESGRVFVSSYNDPDVIAGAGTVGLEIAEDAPDADLVVVGVGGGGLISGLGVSMPEARLWGVQSEARPVLARWMEAGRPVPVESAPSLADGLGPTPEHDTLTFPMMRRRVERMVLVSEVEIQQAMAWALAEHQLVLEPSGAAPLAAMLRERPPAGTKHVVVVVTGRNIEARRYLELMGGAQS
jgi:threonine dehydratase